MFDTNSLPQKLSQFHLFQISKIMNFRKHIQNLRKSLKLRPRKFVLLKYWWLSHIIKGQKDKVYNTYFPYFYRFLCEIFSCKHYFNFGNTTFFKYCIYRLRHAGSIIVVNNIPNLQWRIYPTISFSRMFSQPIERNAN